MPDKIAEIVRAAEVLGLRGEELDHFIVDWGGTPEDYQRYLQRSTVRVVVIVLVLAGAMFGAMAWWFWAPLVELLKG